MRELGVGASELLLLVLGVDGGHPEPDGLQLLGETLPYRLHSEAGETPVRIKQKQVGLQNEKEISTLFFHFLRGILSKGNSIHSMTMF